MNTWETDTINEMEETAKREYDSCCNKKIRGIWLEVSIFEGKFYYKWGKNFVSRDVAVNILKSV